MREPTTLHDLRAQLLSVQDRIDRLEARRPDDDITQHFHLGTVGGSGRPVKALNKRRERDRERMMDIAREVVPLYRERDRLKLLIHAHESGRVERRAKALADAMARVRDAKVGDHVIDSAFGAVTVVRVNQKTLTIETESGYREARPFSLILDVAKTEAT